MKTLITLFAGLGVLVLLLGFGLINQGSISMEMVLTSSLLSLMTCGVTRVCMDDSIDEILPRFQRVIEDYRREMHQQVRVALANEMKFIPAENEAIIIQVQEVPVIPQEEKLEAQQEGTPQNSNTTSLNYSTMLESIDFNEEVPEQFICPWSKKIMSDPHIVYPSRITYDSSSINNFKSELLQSVTHVEPNTALKKDIDKFMEEEARQKKSPTTVSSMGLFSNSNNSPLETTRLLVRKNDSMSEKKEAENIAIKQAFAPLKNAG